MYATEQAGGYSSFPVRISSIAERSRSAVTNTAPLRIHFVSSKRLKVDGTRSGEYGGGGAFLMLFAARNFSDTCVACEWAFPPGINTLLMLLAPPKLLHSLILSSSSFVQWLALNVAPFGRATRKYELIVFQATVSSNGGD
jgi:hypothetical protein